MSTPHGTPTPSPSPDPWARPTPGAAAAPPHAPPPAPAPVPWATGPAGQWAFPAPPPPASTNGWAVTALVTGLIGLVPVAVPAGIAGIVQTTRRRQAGRGLAIAGLVTATFWTVAAVVLVAVFTATWEPRAGTPSDLGAVAVGDCLEAPADGSSRWTSVSCTDLHDAEVYVVDDLESDDADWPGEDDVEVRADDTCHEQFADYTGESYVSSGHDYGWFTPRAGEWADGERRLVCVVVPYDDDVLRAPAADGGD